MKTIRAWFGAVLAAAAMAGCGGGGYSGNSPMPMQNLQSANAPSQPMTLASTTLSTTYGGSNYSLTVSDAPGAMTMFNGQMAATDVLTLGLSQNGTAVSTETTTDYYLTSPYSPLGFSGTSNGVAWTATVTTFTPLPATLTVGSSGTLIAATYKDATGNVIGSLTETYTVTADSPTAVFLNVSGVGTLNGTTATDMLTYSVTSTGVIALVEAQVTVNGVTLTFK
ncbi:MAG TPA: hypothetical protein VH111_02235 [Steroidobacteraceae bacterium]|nr:hypothetical protein [Steroidobacteraceae bacterium]